MTSTLPCLKVFKKLPTEAGKKYFFHKNCIFITNLVSQIVSQGCTKPIKCFQTIALDKNQNQGKDLTSTNIRNDIRTRTEFRTNIRKRTNVRIRKNIRKRTNIRKRANIRKNTNIRKRTNTRKSTNIRQMINIKKTNTRKTKQKQENI